MISTVDLVVTAHHAGAAVVICTVNVLVLVKLELKTFSLKCISVYQQETVNDCDVISEIGRASCRERV